MLACILAHFERQFIERTLKDAKSCFHQGECNVLEF